MGKVSIIGIGPGNDIGSLTLKALECIKNSDIGIYLGEMIGEEIKELFTGKETYFSNNLSITEILSIIELRYKQSKNIALMMPGDASIFSGQFLRQLSLYEYIDWFEKKTYKYEVFAGITSWFALNEKINLDITKYTSSNNIYITSISWQKELNHFDINKFETIVSTKPCIILYQSYERFDYVKPILEKYYTPLTKIIFAYKLSWKEEKIIETTLGCADNFTNNESLSKHTLILILP